MSPDSFGLLGRKGVCRGIGDGFLRFADLETSHSAMARGFAMDDSNIAYYRNRALTELQLAADAKDSCAQVIHLELAKKYQALVDEAVQRPEHRLSFDQALN